MKKQSLKVREIAQNLEIRAPSSCAEDWDNVGLLAGNGDAVVRRALVSADLCKAVVDEAIKRKADLIVTHHPAIFPGGKGRGLSRVTHGADDGVQTQLFRCLENKISVFSSHTNFDKCALEVVEKVSRGVGAHPEGRLFEKSDSKFYKLVTYIPREHFDRVEAAVFDAGAGHIGAYDQCGFVTIGQGSFRGSSFAQPFIGTPERFERVQEARFETIFPRGLKGQILRALKEAHPYEEVAYDVYPVEQSPGFKGLAKGLGYGFYGKFLRATAFTECIKNVRRIFPSSQIVTYRPEPQGRSGGKGQAEKWVQKKFSCVGFVAGKGSSFLSDAKQKGVDLFITGEVDYHDALKAVASGMTVVELGHTESEWWFEETMAEWLCELGLEVHKIRSQIRKVRVEE